MPRVIGIDPGTVSVDLCGLDDGRVYLDRTVPTAEALADPEAFVAALAEGGGVDLVAGPSGYGLPIVNAAEATDEELRLAYLAPAGDGAAGGGGIGGLRALARELGRSGLPVVYTPGVIHLESVPAHRKVNRVDMGTADKVCAAALAIADQARRRRCAPHEVSLILVELGGAFTAVLGIDGGRIVDGVGGSSGPLGLRGAGALDGEVAFLAGAVSKGTIFGGGVEAIVGDVEGWSTRDLVDALLRPRTPREQLAREAFFEGVVKAVVAMLVSVPQPREVLLSGRVANAGGVWATLLRRLTAVAGALPVRQLGGFAAVAKHAAQGAALVADGLAGGVCAGLVERLGLRAARGTVLDHLYVVPREAARWRLGLA